MCNSFSAAILPGHDEITSILQEETAALGGEITDVFDREGLMILRAVVPHVRYVIPGDRVQGGVAIRTCGTSAFVHPYIFRQVCSNGAIMARALESCRVSLVEQAADLPPECGSERARAAYFAQEAALEIRRAIQNCCADEVFAAGVRQMRRSTERMADFALMMAPLLAHLQINLGQRAPAESATHSWLNQILSRFGAERDHSHFGLVNAITALARDTADQDLRWQLEALGGSVLAKLPIIPTSWPMASHDQSEREELAAQLEADSYRLRRNKSVARLASTASTRFVASLSK